jgi:hypothetical protein
VGSSLRVYLSSLMPCQKANAGVELWVVRVAPGLDPGPPGVFDSGPHTGLFVELAAGAGFEILALFEHAARVLPEPNGRFAAPEQERPRLDASKIHQHKLQDPRQQYPQPEFPEQDQRDQHPGLEQEMQPEPDYGVKTYRGSGKLEGKKGFSLLQ